MGVELKWNVLRKQRKKIATIICFICFGMIILGNLHGEKVRRDVELESLIDVVFSVNNITTVKGHSNVHSIPMMTKDKLQSIYDDKYKFKNVPKSFQSSHACINLPENIVENITVYQEYAPLPMLESMGFDVLPGGTFVPNCKATQKTAIIIPFRNRDIHLSVLLLHLHPFLQKQNISYTIFVVNQVANSTFNKGVLMNAGFMEAAKRDKFDCFVFHDVDLLPEDERILYTCSDKGVKHLAYALQEWDYKLLYQSLVGGVVAVTWNQFLRLNGYSNQYFGWGGEDDDFYIRLSRNKLNIIRYPLAVSRYTMVQHHRDKGNDINIKRYELLRKTVTTKMTDMDGLNNLVYSLESIEKLPLFTRFNISFIPEDVMKAKPKPYKFPYLENLLTRSNLVD